ncbi:hypothetical protein FA15DRAFT_665147 [Coprinopsis marcescibilis]|uniref:Uncharacterized protein n=1 Tax=Coprinopsis marcescibilis TaxID=230819 RepID=A0A5C3L9L6_COPMA|nr:hypothetical protein FA15DRAFT_665147 [Coprinopsis marcescibilis]
MARRILEAAVWATIIHQSKLDGSPGVRLHDLVAHTRDPSSVWPAMRLLWDRHAYPGADRGARRRFDSRPWTLYILLYIFVILYGICLPFLFGRAVEIGIQIEQQLSEHIDIIVTGGLSDADTTRLRGLEPFIRNDTFGWSLETSHHNRFAPFSLPWKDDKVFFSGLDERDLDSAAFKTYQPSSNVQTGEYVGTLVERGSGLMMLPRWGLRTDCALISDTGRNIVPRAESGATYVFVSIRDLHPLFENLDLPFPESTLTPLSYPMDLVLPQDTLTTGWELGSVVLGARFDDDGRSFQMNSTVITPTGLEGFIAISTTLVRINTAFAPAGDFSRYSENISSSESPGTRIGYDAAVCVQAYEVWVLEVHRAPDSRPMAGRIVRRATLVGNLNDSGGVGLTGHGDGGLPGHPGQGLDFNKTIPVLGIAHRNGVNVLRKESSVSGQYVASSLLVSATDADTSTPLGYTRLSPAKYAELKGAFDAANVASHLHGSERVVARWYPDAIRATSGIYYSIFAPIVGVAFFVGAVTAFCIPTLPANAPRRGFDLYSWVAALNARELLGTRMGRIQRQMELEAIEQVLVDSRIRYVG